MTENTEILNEYYSFLSENKGSEKTVIAYYSNVQNFLDFTGVNYLEINNLHVSAYFESKKYLKPASLHLIKSAIIDFAKFADIDIGRITGLPKVKRAISFIPTETDFKNFLFYASHKIGYEAVRNKAILSIMYHAGLRIEEAQTMDVDYVDFDERNIYVTGKGRKRRVIPINDTLMNVLEVHDKARSALKPKSSALFLSSGKNHKLEQISYGGFRQIIKSIFVESGMPHLEPYCLRHAFCTRLIKSGADLNIAASLMGHSNVASVFDYYVPENLDGRDAVKALNF